MKPLPLLATLQWRPHLDPLLCGFIILSAVAWLWFVYQRMLQRLPTPKARLLLIPKLLVTLLLLLALFEPVSSIETKEATRGKLLALLDTSSSMDVSDDGRDARLGRARKILQQLKKDLPSDIAIDEMEFDISVRKPGQGPKPAGVRETDLGGALLSLSERSDISAYLGALLLTDGGDETIDSAALPPVPLYIIGIGSDPSKWNDIGIAEVQCPPTVEKDVEFEVNVDLKAYAGGGKNFASQLSKVGILLEAERGGKWQRITDKSVDLSNQRARVTLAISEKDLGLHHYRLSLDRLNGELSYLNNIRAFSVDVQKKSLHILYFTRELGMDFKMLRGELGRDPGIAFTALFRTFSERFNLQGDRQPGDEELEAGFPATEKILQLYDCLILGSFPAEDWTAPQMKVLSKYVEDGGVVVFLGGDKSFGRGGYARTPLAALMPWQITDRETDTAQGVFPVNIPVAASSHPILRGVDEQLIQQGAALESANSVGDLRPGAASLLEIRLGGRVLSVVAVQPFGKGKVMGIASNTLWKWATKSESLKTAFGLFWRQAVRNLTGKEEGGRAFTVKWDNDGYRPGELAVAEIRGSSVSPADNLRFTATVSLKNETSPLTVEAVQGQPNAFSTKIRLRERGEYAFKLTAFRCDTVLETYEKTLRVAPLVAEGARLELDHEFLRKLAARGSGAYLPESEAGHFVKQVAAGLWQRSVTVESSLVQAGPWFAALFLLVLVVEWTLRRRMNLF